MSTANSPISDQALHSPATDRAAGNSHAHAHVVQFYGEDQSLIDALSRMVGTALGAGDSAIVIATEAHREALARKLKSRGFNTAAALAEGRYVVLDAADTLSQITVDGWPDESRFMKLIGGIVLQAQAAAEGANSQVLAFGEMVSLLWDEGKSDAAIYLEQLWNELAKTHKFSLRCAYPIGKFGREQDTDPFLKICAEHSCVIPSESYTELVTEEERLRSISVLQQKAQALELEAAERKDVEHSLRLREAELAEILKNAVEGVQQVGPDQTILWTNRALLELLGFSEQEYVGHSLREFHADSKVFEEFWARLMRREDIYDFPADLRCKNGSIKQVTINSNGRWEDGKFVHTRCFVRDVTEPRRLEQSLRNAEKEAAMGRVAAMIAHEINNPLETVTNVFYLLRDHPSLDEDARELARIANEEIRRVRHIAKQTLAFYRDAESPVPVSLRLVLEDVLNAFHRQAALSQVKVELKFSTDDTVLAFPIELRQIFVNLIANALQAMPDGGKLRVSLRNHSDGRQGLARAGIQIRVTDTGLGIADENRDKIFQPFFTTKSDKGTGLGLWVSRGIIQKLNGTLEFRSIRSRGRALTSFSVFIPTDGSGVSIA